ncbi:MAG: hypothetical protein AVDCRST_MAG69-1165 [uncultured Solirubrobacteraceae bacterium]|uniref:NAD-dependent epimerase/dehydratase domain-containing protein n=1 Tax=uncultured Solirubrobacteraceae bacterium TaxID=1162706 RepID=A0A6J4S6X2_9ACTN|nr:MAG: hypothetical protein AVDCRST_MAG69-1165 [uncultured Solirubrobacteraceae bacterium]
MRILITGVSGFVGAAVAPHLTRDGHFVRGFARSAERVAASGAPVDELVLGDAVTGAGLDRALDSIDVAYYLMHSMAGTGRDDFAEQELRSAERFAAAARHAGVRRIVFLGGLLPAGASPSRHLASRLAVERELLTAAEESIAFRASIVIGARSRSFRFLVRLVERLPVMALPAWRDNRTQPIDGRDVLSFLVRAADAPASATGRSWDIAGPEAMSYADLIAGIADAMMVSRPTIGLNLTLTPIASVIAAAIAGEDVGLVEPLMESLEHDLLPGDMAAADVFGVRLHSFTAAVERALRDLDDEPADPAFELG